jgi:hypothetical protein
VKSLFLLCAFALSGCVRLSAVTTPPPTRTAALDDYNETIEVSAGAALGFECWHSDFWTAAPCPNATARTDDPNTARVYPAYIDQLVPDYRRRSMSEQVGFVVVGISPGTTVLRIKTDGTEDEYLVKVVE